MRKKIRLSKSEMTGFIVLVIVFSSIGLLYHYRESLFSKEEKVTALTPQEQQEVAAFAQQITEDSIRQANRFKKKREKQHRLSPITFDPNTADSLSLVKIGLYDWQVKNLLKYRRKGGKWKKPEDFAHLYGLSKEDFEQLKPYIHIAKTKEEIKAERRKVKNDSIHRTYPKKFEKGTILALNEADTTSLKGIPGIGSYYASKICRYRERLGGFVSLEQLKEIEGLPEDIEEWFTLPIHPQVKQININKTSFKGLVRHPYLNYEQVKTICNYIRKYGKISSWEELSNSENFTKEDFERLKPYISFD